MGSGETARERQGGLGVYGKGKRGEGKRRGERERRTVAIATHAGSKSRGSSEAPER